MSDFVWSFEEKDFIAATDDWLHIQVDIAVVVVDSSVVKEGTLSFDLLKNFCERLIKINHNKSN